MHYKISKKNIIWVNIKFYLTVKWNNHPVDYEFG